MSFLKGKIVLITGGGSGMGNAIALTLSKQGAKVAILGRRIDLLQKTALLIEKEGEKCFYDSVDISRRDEVNDFVEQLIKKWKRIDILVNSAAINTPNRLWADTIPDEWDHVIEVNLTGTYNSIQAVLPHMREKRSGLIININSGAGRKPSKWGGLAYSASKHGMISLTQSLNIEEWENGIRATDIIAGETNTPLLKQRKFPLPPERYEVMLQPEDIAHVVEFLTSLPDHLLVEDIRPRPTSRKFLP
jgi:NADP-dependent 3-hydroxy acid dehydrogenase YdfG